MGLRVGVCVWVCVCVCVCVGDRLLMYRIAGNFRGTKYLWFSNIETFRG